jgi:WD40 repeat protein
MQKMENWPKLPTQRLPKKAHLFEGHDAAVTALEAMGGRRPQFLSASEDGTIRAWDAAKGKEAYRMDGFSADLTSLCLQGGSDTDDDLLITDGMKQYVCIHDFADGIADDSIDDYFEQWDD